MKWSPRAKMGGEEVVDNKDVSRVTNAPQVSLRNSWKSRLPKWGETAEAELIKNIVKGILIVLGIILVWVISPLSPIACNISGDLPGCERVSQNCLSSYAAMVKCAGG